MRRREDQSLTHFSSLFSCVISSLCIANMEFQDINPTSQVALFALDIVLVCRRSLGRSIEERSIHRSTNRLVGFSSQSVNIALTSLHTRPFSLSLSSVGSGTIRTHVDRLLIGLDIRDVFALCSFSASLVGRHS